jgi:putative transposase
LRKPRGPKPKLIQLTERQRKILEQIVRRAQSAQCMVLRSKIILMADDGLNNQYMADDLDIHVQTPRRWRNRWAEAAERLKDLETDLDDKALHAHIKEVLSDEPRSGTPATFTAEQICQIIALSCEPPEASGRPVTHWTHAELTDEVIQRNIVESISPRSVGRFLKGRGPETASDAILAEQ